jgi:RNA polymerase sigma factor for flagellar operon FliA
MKSKYPPIDKEAAVAQFLPRIRYYARKYSFCTEMEEEDLVSAGIIGLMESIERYDHSRNITLSTFADFRIRGAILDEISSMQWISKDALKKIDTVKKAYDQLEKKLGRSVTEEEVAEKLSMTVEDLHEILSRVGLVHMLKLDDIGVSGDGDGRKLDILECVANKDRDILEELELKEMQAFLGGIIESLPERERMVTTLYYYEELTMKEIGKILDISESRVCQMHGAVLIKLKNKIQQYVPLTKE